MATLEFTALGGGSEIGANSYLLAAEGHSILLDCGLHPKKEGVDALPDFSRLNDVPEAVIVSHGHIDHCGAVPYLVKRFPSIECYATPPTVQIMDRMLHNSVSVMGTLALEQGIEGYPLYSHSDVDLTIRRTYGLDLGREFALTWDSPFTASFHHAGHVLGSASILLQVEGHTVFYTGDVCMGDQELMGGLTLPADGVHVDTLIVESTRGAHVDVGHATYSREVERLAAEVASVLERGGTVLVPSFALGRTQELLNIIARLIESGRLPDVPVYASGLGRAIYEVYGKWGEYLRPDATLRPLSDFARIGDVWERGVRRELLRKPCIIVATSGMMVENTPSAMIAMDVVRHTHHAIFFVGYLDPDTPGYRLLHAEPGERVVLESSAPPVEVLLENRQSFNLSAHATREQLGELIARIEPTNVVFVHGDADAVAWMRSHCNGRYRGFAPLSGETLALEA
ncbi:MAG: MBL fold metallo-hydrolase [Candidatus Hydrogenedentes bacterium]|nr:MBL fold metallo-hydrolase [Candidatus Hydrogenedentota bacterium]